MGLHPEASTGPRRRFDQSSELLEAFDLSSVEGYSPTTGLHQAQGTCQIVAFVHKDATSQDDATSDPFFAMDKGLSPLYPLVRNPLGTGDQLSLGGRPVVRNGEVQEAYAVVSQQFLVVFPLFSEIDDGTNPRLQQTFEMSRVQGAGNAEVGCDP